MSAREVTALGRCGTCQEVVGRGRATARPERRASSLLEDDAVLVLDGHVDHAGVVDGV